MTATSNPFRGIFINDTETATDLLYYEAIAKTVVGYIDGSGEKPISIGVHGDWGAGKSSVLKMVEAEYAKRDDVLCLWFNGWQLEGFDDAKAALIETIVLELRDQRSRFDKVKELAADVLKNLDYLKLAKTAVKVGGSFVTGIPHPGLVGDAVGLLKSAASMLDGEGAKGEIAKTLAEGVGKLEQAKAGKKVPEEMKEFRQAFKALLEAAKIKRLVVLIDDLDRCLPETVIATLEAIRLFLFAEKTAFVIGADEQMVEYAVKRHFPEFQRSGLPEAYARYYLEKLIQVPFRIPALGAVETQCYVTLVMAEAILSQPENKEAFTKLAAMSKTTIARPWASQPMDAAQIDQVIKGQVAVPLKEAIALSMQLYRILSEGTKGNPRLIKRFLNAVLIRYAIAAERQLINEIKFPQLAKVMLAERFHPTFFDQLVNELAQSGGSTGRVALLRLLETGDEKSTPKDLNGDQKKLLDEWKADTRLATWARVQPPLFDEDLRPYVFVTRDRKQSIFGFGVAGHLTALAEKLCGDSYAIAAAKTEVVALNPKDAMDVAQNLKATAQASGETKNKPRGFEGLVALSSNKPETRPVLLNLLQSFDAAQLGSWAWPELKALADDPNFKAEAAALQKAWSAQGGEKLKQAIKAFPL
jgi:predicted KAP-like P-loop ATPase